MAEQHGARVIREAVASRSRARNAGVAAARADLIAFTDADCVAERGWLEQLLACRGRAPLIAGRVDIVTSERPNAVERFEKVWRFAQEAFAAQGWAATANLCVERAPFEAVGGFDPAYRHIAEDADFCLRAGRAGFGIAYCHPSVVLHHAERGMWPLLRRSYFHGYSSAQALRRIGVGHVAWREPAPLLSPRAALARLGVEASALEAAERRVLGGLAVLNYAGRVAGSLAAQAQGAR